MNLTRPIPGPSDDPDLTLGTLLFAGAAKPPTTETAWVALVREISTGDQGALRELYERMHALVYTLIVRIVRDNEAAEELTLDVFHDIWRRAAGYEESGGSVVGWVMNQARSRAIDRLRFDHRRKRVDPYPDAAIGTQEDESATSIDTPALERSVRMAVAGLGPMERSAIELAFFADCSYAEVAVRLGEPAGTVKTRIRAGLHKLRHALDPENRL